MALIGASSRTVLSDASTVELHRAEVSPQPPAAAHAPAAAPSPSPDLSTPHPDPDSSTPHPDPDPSTPHAAPSPKYGMPDALTPAAEDGPPAPVLCDSPAGVLGRRGLPALSTAGSAVLGLGVGLGLGLGQAAAHPETEAAQTASAPRALTGNGEPCQGLGRGLPECARASEAPVREEELLPPASLPARPSQAGAEAEQRDAGLCTKGGHHEALAAGSACAGLLTACKERAGTLPGQHDAAEVVAAHAPSTTALSCGAAEAGVAEDMSLADAHGEASISLLAEAGAMEPEARAGAHTEAGAALGATPGPSAAAARACAEAMAAASKGPSASQDAAPSVTDDAAAARDPKHTVAMPAIRVAASPALGAGDSGGACDARSVHGGAEPGGDELLSDPDPSPAPAPMVAGAAEHRNEGACATGGSNPATLHDPGAPALAQGALASSEPAVLAAGSANPQNNLDPVVPSLPGEVALVGGEPGTPPGLLAAMAACEAGAGSLGGALRGEGPREGAAEAELPPLDSAGRREVHLRFGIDISSHKMLTWLALTLR